jgi:hypothetical protein
MLARIGPNYISAAYCSLILDLTRGGAVKGCMESKVGSAPELGKPKLLDQVRAVLRLKHYSPRTEQSYVDWIKRFILFHGKRHPETMSAEEVREFLSNLATAGGVAASTQNQAFRALLFLYRDVLKHELPWIGNVERAKRPAKLPVAASRSRRRLRRGRTFSRSDRNDRAWNRARNFARPRRPRSCLAR